jgi:hypothetical protein
MHFPQPVMAAFIISQDSSENHSGTQMTHSAANIKISPGCRYLLSEKSKRYYFRMQSTYLDHFRHLDLQQLPEGLVGYGLAMVAPEPHHFRTPRADPQRRRRGGRCSEVGRG